MKSCSLYFGFFWSYNLLLLFAALLRKYCKHFAYIDHAYIVKSSIFHRARLFFIWQPVKCNAQRSATCCNNGRDLTMFLQPSFFVSNSPLQVTSYFKKRTDDCYFWLLIHKILASKECHIVEHKKQLFCGVIEVFVFASIFHCILVSNNCLSVNIYIRLFVYLCLYLLVLWI